jgi:ABC-type antimicrobial peptide transport system permease subunit
LLAGRDFTPADRLGAPRVAIVNESFVRKFNLGEQAIGARFANDGPSRDIEIVGIVRDAKYNQVRAETRAQFFLSRLQNDNLGSMTFYARAGGDPQTLTQTIRETVARIDPNLPLANLATMQRQVHDNMFLDRFVSWLSTILALLAAFLAGVGLYGVLAFGVANRTRELGLRLALGAAPGRLRVMMLKQVGAMAVVGGGIGLVAAIGLGRAVESLLVGVSGYDPVVLVSAVALLAVVIFGASYFPARRASRLAPMTALRHD